VKLEGKRILIKPEEPQLQHQPINTRINQKITKEKDK
jgi:hypothetical protein